MQINDPTSAGVSSTKMGGAQSTGSVTRGGRNGVASSRGEGSDQVQLSDLASTVRSLASDSPERSARLDRLASEVQGGRYQVDATALSVSIVSAALQGF